MNIGSLNKRIQIIEIKASEPDEEGFESVGTERIVWECWAKVSATSGTELIKSGADLVSAKTRFFIRHTSVEIKENMIVRYNGIDYPIELVNTYGDNHEYMELWTQRMEHV